MLDSTLMPKQAGLFGSGISRNSPLEGHSPRDFASTMPGTARSQFYFVFILTCHDMLQGPAVTLQHCTSQVLLMVQELQLGDMLQPN